MGIISDAIDALEDWCKDLFKDGIQSQFDGISDLLSDTFSQTTGSGGSGGLVNDFVTQHPSQFTGGGTGGTTIWSTIETLCNNVVVPIGGFILTVILLNELIQMVLRGNNFKDFDDSIFIKWIIKALCGVILVANTYYIASALFSFGTTVCSNGLATLFGSGDYLSETLSINRTALSGLSLGELMTVWFISLIVHLGVLILIVAIVITLASRIIEVFMYLSIAPIPMATMMDSGEWASIGKNWIKQLLALSFQGFFIVVALGIFKTLFSNAIVALNASTDGVILQMGLLLAAIPQHLSSRFSAQELSQNLCLAHIENKIGGFMAHYVPIPKELNDIKEKFIMGFTKRQVICFGIGLVLGAPVYFLTRASIGMSGAIFAMGAVAAPAILCGIYKKNGVFLEKQVKFMREYFTRPRKRYYRTTNIFVSIERQIEYNRIKKKLRDAERK